MSRPSLEVADVFRFHGPQLPIIAGTVAAGIHGHLNDAPWLNWVISSWQTSATAGVPLIILLLWFYALIKQRAALKIRKSIPINASDLGAERRECMINAFTRNTGFWNRIFRTSPVGWGWRSKRALRHVFSRADRYVQELNNTYTSGQQDNAATTTDEAAVAEKTAEGQSAVAKSAEETKTN